MSGREGKEASRWEVGRRLETRVRSDSINPMTVAIIVTIYDIMRRDVWIDVPTLLSVSSDERKSMVVAGDEEDQLEVRWRQSRLPCSPPPSSHLRPAPSS